MKQVFHLLTTIFPAKRDPALQDQFLLITFLLSLIAFPTPTFAQTRDFGTNPMNPEVVTAPGASAPDVATIKGLETIFYNIVVVALGFAGIVLFIMLVTGGFKYLTSGGNQDQAQAAQQTLTYAFLGFVLLVAGFLIIRLLEAFTGLQLNVFQITR